MNKILLHPPKRKIQNRIVPIEGSKSYTNRALIIASLAKGKSILLSPSISNDSKVLIQALITLGVSIKNKVDGSIEIMGNEGKFVAQNISLNVGQAGTAMRFLTALSALVPGIVCLDGSSRMRQRPIGELTAALTQLGVRITFSSSDGFPPLTVNGGIIKKNMVTMSGKVSSQFITALLLVGPCISGGLTIEICDEQISKSYIDMTIDSMKQFGVTVINDNYKRYIVPDSSEYRAQQYTVEGDASGASYLFGIAAVSGSSVTVSNINPLSSQGDIHFVDILEKMGCNVVRDTKKNTISVTGPSRLRSVVINMESMPDTAQTLAVVASFAKGTTIITGLSTLKVKETDRLEAIKNELKKWEWKV